MFRALAHAMASGVFGAGVLRNAVLESFTIHTRALLDFLYTDEPKESDDVIAGDFFDDPRQWCNLRPDKTETLKRAHRRVNKEVAHLTYFRVEVTPETKGWPYIQIANEIEYVFDVFLRHVAGNRLDPSWGRAASKNEGETSIAREFLGV